MPTYKVSRGNAALWFGDKKTGHRIDLVRGQEIELTGEEYQFVKASGHVQLALIEDSASAGDNVNPTAAKTAEYIPADSKSANQDLSWISESSVPEIVKVLESPDVTVDDLVQVASYEADHGNRRGVISAVEKRMQQLQEKE